MVGAFSMVFRNSVENFHCIVETAQFRRLTTRENLQLNCEMIAFITINYDITFLRAVTMLNIHEESMRNPRPEVI